MPPKKKKEGKKKEEPLPGQLPEDFLNNYKKFCKLCMVPECPQIIETLTDEEKLEVFNSSKQFVIHPVDPQDENEPRLGLGGVRAITTTILAKGKDVEGNFYMKPVDEKGFPIIYKQVKSLRIWWSNIGDDGCRSIAELLRLGGEDVQINYLELWDNNITASGADAIGRSLQVGWNRSLLTLKLDYNRTLGSDGVMALCKGLRTNSSLKQLHVPFCAIDARAGAPLAEMLTYAKLGLTLLNLQGNRLSGDGLLDLCIGLQSNKSLTDLNLADNEIEGRHVEALTKLAEVMELPATIGGNNLSKVNLLYNRIGVEGAQIFQPKLTPENKKINTFLVDASLPEEIFTSIMRNNAGGGGKGKKGKKGKKK